MPTISMLADGGSKVMDDKLAQALLRDCGWWPEEYKLLKRATMDGAELIDRRRRTAEETADEDQAEFGVSLAGDTFSWFYGCSGLLVAGGGCGGTCPWCTESHYDDPERKSFLSFWTGTDDLPEGVLAGPSCSGAGVASLHHLLLLPLLLLLEALPGRPGRVRLRRTGVTAMRAMPECKGIGCLLLY